jgi:hypothetical protein
VPGRNFDFLDHDLLLLQLRLVLALGFLVLELADVHDLADRGTAMGAISTRSTPASSASASA